MKVPASSGAARLSLVAIAAAGLVAATGAAPGRGQTLEPVAVLEGPVDHVRAAGDLVYLSAGSTFTVVDVSDPTAPVRRGSHTFPEQVWGFRVHGDRAYVGANFFGLAVVDLSDPDRPRVVGRLETLGQAKIGAAFGDRVAVIDHMDGVVVGDLSDESAPSLVATYFVDGYGRDVVADGPIAYAVDSPEGLYVFDLSSAAPEEPIGERLEPGMPRSIE
ncbi:MAG: hypothetical protein R3190_15535, partial [Thermoanaerobaculia bacterium]|nr:hypothetical protein [Thermoanaerobaculia bacterium]